MSLLKEILSIPMEGNMEDLLKYWQQDFGPAEEPLPAELNVKGLIEIFDDTETTTKPNDLYPFLDDLLDEGISDSTFNAVDLGDFLETFDKSTVDATYSLPDVLSTDINNFLVDNGDMTDVSTPTSPAASFVSLSSPESIEIEEVSSEPGMYVELKTESGDSPVYVQLKPALDSKPTSELESILKDTILVPAVSATVSPAPESVRFAPYKRTSQKATSKKERKRLQNQQAAVRYRQKKKQESDTFQKQESRLREENAKLTEKVTGLEKEIKYIKDLLVEVYKAKGLLKQAKQIKRL